MQRVRYVGSAPAQIMDTQFSFTTYGQSVQMSDEMLEKCRLGRVHVITEEEFQSLGHPPEELKRNAKFDTHPRASDEFQGRLRKAWAIAQSAHQAALAPPPAEPVEGGKD